MHSIPKNDPQQILRALNLLFPERSVVELRSLQGKATISGYFDDYEALAKAASGLREGNTYITLNRIDPSLLARCANRIERAKNTTTDAQVIRRQLLLIDCDCQRPSGISATDEEHEAAIEKAKEIGRHLSAQGWPQPILADSGNGAHLLYRIDLPNDTGSAKLVQRLFSQLAIDFDDNDGGVPCVKVDQSVFNASRICKLYGTVARKGDHTPDRPHRLSHILYAPEAAKIVACEQLEAYAGPEPAPPELRQNSHTNGTVDLANFITTHLKVRQEGAYTNSNGAIHRWKIETCPLCGESDKSAVVLQFGDGRIGYRCQHNRCTGKDWKALREHFEPGYRDRSNQPPTTVTKTPPKPKTKARAEILPSRPFPIEALPPVIGNYVRAAATAIGCDPAFIALPLMACLARAIGNRRAIRLKRTWMELPIIWCAIVGKSGTHKTPALNMAMQFLQSRQAESIVRFEEAQATYEQQLALYDRDYAAWKRSGKPEEPPPWKPEEPVCQRYLTTDITIEALAERLAAQFDGLLVTRDELAGWLGGIAEYKGGKGSDLGHWLATWSGAPLTVDRKTGAKKFLHVPRASVSLVGGIQPGVLQRAIGREHLQDGLCARLLLAMPEPRPVVWSEAVVDPQTEEALGEVFDRLLALESAADEEGNPAPYARSLTPEAKAAWVEYFNRHRAELVDLDDDLAAAWSKLEAYTARFALIFQMVEDDSEVDEVSMRSAIELSDWFGHEASRVYGLFHEDDEDRETRDLITWIQRHGRSVTVRDLTRGPRQFRNDPAAAEAALGALVNAGYGRWEQVPTTSQGGQPTRRFFLEMKDGGDRTPKTPAFEEVPSPSPVSPVFSDNVTSGGDLHSNGQVGNPSDDSWGDIQ